MTGIDANALEAVTKTIIEALGAPSSTAGKVASSLVDSNRCGHDSHGVRLLAAKYAPEIEEGKIDPTSTPALTKPHGNAAVINGNKAFGQLAAREAVDVGLTLADEHGVGVVGLRGVSHIGRVGEWAERAAPDAALLAFVSNPGSRWVAPPGTATRRLSTNPIVVGIPTYGALPFPIVHDAATSQIAHGKIREYQAEGRALPEGWAIDADGEYLTDPTRFEDDGDGAILPLGGLTSGYKGFGLAVIAELLASIVSDGDVSGTSQSDWGNHAAFVVIDPTRFSTRSSIVDRLTVFAEYIRSTPRAPSVDIGPGAKQASRLLPGEAEYEVRQERKTAGIPLPPSDRASLVALGRRVGVEEDVLSVVDL